jgi:endonuclease/exonuclease/phosphatase family metal-dependent hydrolase
LNLVFAPATERLVGIWPLDKVIVGLLGFKEGPAILSRFPIAATEVYDLPRGRRVWDPRILLRADVATPCGLLHVFSTHTSGQTCQAEHIGRIVSERRSRNPSVVMGDFNALETSSGLVTLREEHGFVDTFRLANPAIPGPTVWQRIEAKHSTVSRRVDFLFVINGRELIATIRFSRLAFDQPGRLLNGGFLWPSDHYGVLGELEFLPPKSRPR